jgi:hypothetical protein
MTSAATRRWTIARKEQVQQARWWQDTAVLYNSDIAVTRMEHEASYEISSSPEAPQKHNLHRFAFYPGMTRGRVSRL